MLSFAHNLHRAIPWHAPCCAACSRSLRCFPGRPPGAFVYSVVKVQKPLTPCRQVQNCYAILTLAAVAVYGGFAMSHARQVQNCSAILHCRGCRRILPNLKMLPEKQAFQSAFQFGSAWLIAARKKKIFIQNSEWQAASAVLFHLFVHRSSFANGL